MLYTAFSTLFSGFPQFYHVKYFTVSLQICNSQQSREMSGSQYPSQKGLEPSEYYFINVHIGNHIIKKQCKGCTCWVFYSVDIDVSVTIGSLQLNA
jgi:hypothetical protein